MSTAREWVNEYPDWSKPIFSPAKYKGAFGGRAGGKSHMFGQYTVEDHIADPNFRTVCIREYQKSLQYSSKALIEAKIRASGYKQFFNVTKTQITRRFGTGLIIFEGMQDHNADSIKSLEGFDVALCEEANRLSKRSLRLLRPTILRKPGAEIRAIWNPEFPNDPIDDFFRGPNADPTDTVLVNVNYNQNPWATKEVYEEAERDKKNDPDNYDHIWLGDYIRKSDAEIFAGKWKVEEFTPTKKWNGPYYGLDFGFSTDPCALIKCWEYDNFLYVESSPGKKGLDLDDTTDYFKGHCPHVQQYVIRADNARPESISYLRKHGLPKIIGVDKWPGSVEDGISFLRSFNKIIIHPQAENIRKEARLYKYKVDKRTEDILPEIVDAHNHWWDALRYAIQPMIKKPKKKAGVL